MRRLFSMRSGVCPTCREPYTEEQEACQICFRVLHRSLQYKLKRKNKIKDKRYKAKKKKIVDNYYKFYK